MVVLLDERDWVDFVFRSATKPFDTAFPMESMLVQMLGMFAQFERDAIVHRVVIGARGIAKLLNERGHRNTAGGTWSGQQILRALTEHISANSPAATTQSPAVTHGSSTSTPGNAPKQSSPPGARVQRIAPRPAPTTFSSANWTPNLSGSPTDYPRSDRESDQRHRPNR
ncbi:hypothetical protein BJ987_002543 [Nocardia goodfellowii]|uniref:Resolvase/invertase-type recombinase catalytic domain-containing protein n=2 Tax=Nocardia goodfellowii TaxID=882446 RepID=A0ABS4QDA6_9NOCA|nr:hypothetical protein [Nocardia goodfellowii]